MKCSCNQQATVNGRQEFLTYHNYTIITHEQRERDRERQRERQRQRQKETYINPLRILSKIAFTRDGRGVDLRVLRNERRPPLRGRGRAEENFAEENLMLPRLLVKEGEEEEARVDAEYILLGGGPED